MEIRKITVSNRSGHTARLDITSYFEPVIGSPEADLAHPAFSKLFISTEFHDKGNVLLASRRPSKPEQKQFYLFSSMLVKGRLGGAFEFETDRNRFLGRGRTAANPIRGDGSFSKQQVPMASTDKATVAGQNSQCICTNGRIGKRWSPTNSKRLWLRIQTAV